MSSSTAPLHKARVITLSLAWCFAVIAASVGLNALIKSNQDKSRLKKLAPPPAIVDINTNDIYVAGIVATTASLLISVIVSKFVIGMFLPSMKALSARTLRLQAVILFVASLFLLGSMIPYMYYYANRHAIVKAFIGTTQLPDAIVKGVEKSSGSTSIYKDIYYLKLVAILPWFALVSTLVAAAVLFKAGSASRKAPVMSHRSPSPEMIEKEEESRQEKVGV